MCQSYSANDELKRAMVYEGVSGVSDKHKNKGDQCGWCRFLTKFSLIPKRINIFYFISLPVFFELVHGLLHLVTDYRAVVSVTSITRIKLYYK